MRILHISEAFGGGLRTAVCNFIAATPESSHTVCIRVRIGHETIDLPPSTEVHEITGSIPRFVIQAASLARAGEYDIVHIHSSFAGLVRPFLPVGGRIIYSPHCYAMEDSSTRTRRVLYGAVERLLSQRSQMLVAVSPHEQAIGHRLNPSMLSVVVANAAPPASITTRPAAPRQELPTRRTIAMIGRLSPQKDPLFFADVVSRLEPSRYAAVWIGDGDLGAERLRELGVEITGWLAPSQILERLQNVDLYVHVARWEGGPLAPLEAAANGCPVISRSIPSMTSLGYPSAGTTPAKVAATIETFFSEPKRRKDVLAQTHQLTQTYSFEMMARELRNAYGLAMRKLGTKRPANGPNIRQ